MDEGHWRREGPLRAHRRQARRAQVPERQFLADGRYGALRAVLGDLLGPRAGHSGRAAGIEGARQDAVRLSAEANARGADYERRLEAARARAQEERRKIRTDATTIHREVTDMAKAKASSAVGHAREKLQRDMESIRADLMPRAERLAADIASKLLGREVA